MATVHNPQQLADEIGVASPDKIGKAIFKTTECGCVFNHTESDVTVAGYAEGADAECENHTLVFPFEMVDFWSTLSAADAEGVEMWHEWNQE